MTHRFKDFREAGLDDNTSLTTGIQYFIFVTALIRNAYKVNFISEDFKSNT